MPHEHINRSMFETTKNDKGKVVTHFDADGIPGGGFSALLIAGLCPDGEKEILELRFKSSFLPHINNLKVALEDLLEKEEAHKEWVIEAAEKLMQTEPDDTGNCNCKVPTKEDRVPKRKPRFYRESSFHNQMREALKEFFKYFAVDVDEEDVDDLGPYEGTGK